MRLLQILISAAIVTLTVTGCRTVDDERIPNLPVNIDLSNAGLWNSFGVFGFGTSRDFIYTRDKKEPSTFPYNGKSATGFGGVLLIEGIDPLTGVGSPLAYDLACPVEREPAVRVYINPETSNAQCPDCGSIYDVCMAGGAPIYGPAATGKYKYGLKSYRCVPGIYGGYTITN